MVKRCMDTPGQSIPTEDEPTDLRHDTMDFADTPPIEPESPIDDVINEGAEITAVELEHLENDEPGNIAAAYNMASMDAAADPSTPGEEEEEEEPNNNQSEDGDAIDNQHHRK